MQAGSRDHDSHDAMLTPRTPIHLGRPSKIQRYSSSMHRSMEEDSLITRYDDDDRWGHSGEGCVLASTLCKYDLKNGYLFILSWTRGQQVMQGSISSELLMRSGGARSILLLPLVARCLETIDVCIWYMFVFIYVVVIVLGLWESLLCSGRC